MRIIPSTLVLLAITFPLTGCTVIGGLIGDSIDSSRPDSVMFSRTSSTNDLVIGEEATIVMLEDSTVSGELLPFRWVQQEQYQRTYLQWLDTTFSGKIMPPLWKHVTLAGQSSESVPRHDAHIRLDCLVVGFDPSEIFVADMKGRAARPFSLALVDTLLLDEKNLLTGLMLRHIVEDERPPLMSMMGFRQGDDTLWVPLDQVRRGSLKVSKNATLTGILVGAAIDVATYFLVIRNIEFHPFAH